MPGVNHILPEKIIQRYNSNVIGVQITFQRKHWKGGKCTLLFSKPYNLDSYFAVKGKSYSASYWIGFFFIHVYIHAVHKGV